MRLNMHRPTPGPSPTREKVTQILLSVTGGLFLIPFIIAAVVDCIETASVSPLLLLPLISALGCLFGAQMYLSEKRSYIEMDECSVTAVEYSWFRWNKQRFDLSQIASAQYFQENKRYSNPYIRILDRDGKHLFDVYRCEASIQAFSAYLQEQKLFMR